MLISHQCQLECWYYRDDCLGQVAMTLRLDQIISLVGMLTKISALVLSLAFK